MNRNAFFYIGASLVVIFSYLLLTKGYDKILYFLNFSDNNNNQSQSTDVMNELQTDYTSKIDVINSEIAEINNKLTKLEPIYFIALAKRSSKIIGDLMFTDVYLESEPGLFDLPTSKFKCKKPGVYRFTFTGLRYYFVLELIATKVAIYKNDEQLAQSSTTVEMLAKDLNLKMAGGETLSMNTLTMLTEGDVVYCKLLSGGIFSSVDENITQFTGELVRAL